MKHVVCFGVVDVSSEAACARSCVLGELQNSSLPVWAGTDNTDIGWVFDRNQNAGCQDQLLPRHVQINDVNTILPPCKRIALHMLCQVLGPKVDLAGQKFPNVIFSRIKCWSP